MITGSNRPEPECNNDHHLLLRIQAGEAEAAKLLYERYAEHLKCLATRQTTSSVTSRVDAEDIVQSVFRTFFRRVVHDHYWIPEGDDLWKLFLVITPNKIRNLAAYHTAGKRDARLTVGLSSPQFHLTDPNNQDTEYTALKLMIQELLAKLPSIQQDMIQYRLEGYEIDEIAEKTKRSKRSVERILQNFRDQLKALLQSESP